MIFSAIINYAIIRRAELHLVRTQELTIHHTLTTRLNLQKW